MMPYLFIFEVMLAAGGIVKLRRNRRKNVGRLYLLLRAFFKGWRPYILVGHSKFASDLDGIGLTSLPV